MSRQNRPRQHQVGHEALQSVALVWSKAGAAVEFVQQDYGEDLVIQLRNSHLLRWRRLPGLVVVIAWSIGGDIGWFKIISHDIGPVDDLIQAPEKRSAFTFPNENRFDPEHAKLLCLQAVERQASDELFLQDAYNSGAEPSPSSRINQTDVALSTIVSLGIAIENSGKFQLSTKFRDQVTSNFEKIEACDDVGSMLIEATSLAILQAAQIEFTVNLIEKMTYCAVQLLAPRDGWSMPIP